MSNTQSMRTPTADHVHRGLAAGPDVALQFQSLRPND